MHTAAGLCEGCSPFTSLTVSFGPTRDIDTVHCTGGPPSRTKLAASSLLCMPNTKHTSAYHGSKTKCFASATLCAHLACPSQHTHQALFVIHKLRDRFDPPGMMWIAGCSLPQVFPRLYSRTDAGEVHASPVSPIATAHSMHDDVSVSGVLALVW